MKIKTLSRKHFYTPVLVVFLVGLVFLTFSVNSYAAGSQTYHLPYIIYGAGLNSLFDDNAFDCCMEAAYDNGLTSSDHYIIYPTEYWYNDALYHGLNLEIIFNPQIAQGWYYDPDFDYSTTGVPVYGTKRIEVRITYNGSFNTASSVLSNTTKYLLGEQRTRTGFLLGNHEGNFTPYYPTYLSNSGLSDSHNHLVFAQDVVINQPSSGTPTGPNTGHHIQSPNGGTPSNPPSYTINNYSWTTYTPPVVDLTTIEGLLKGIIDSVQSIGSWLGSNLSGMVANLISNIKGLFDFVGDLLRYIGREIQDSIHDFASFIYDNLVSFFEPYFDTFNNALFGLQELFSLGYDSNGSFSVLTFLTALIVPDPSDMLTSFLSYDTVGVNNLVYSMVTVGKTTLSTLFNLTPVKTLYIPSTTWHGRTIGGFYVSFLWYEDFKVYGDTIISAFLIVGYLYWLFTSLSSVLRGSNTSEIPQSEPSHNPIGFNR